MPAGIVIVGLGSGSPDLLTRRAQVVLESASELYLRTSKHPLVATFPAAWSLHSFDELYQRLESFAEVYAAIVDQIIILGGRPDGVVYAVPGDPMVGEATTPAIRARAAELGLPLEIVHGVSFIEPSLRLMNWDALDGLTVVDALDLIRQHLPPFPPDSAALVGQVHSKIVAAELKLTLMNQYPDEHPVSLIHAAGTQQEQIEQLQLHAIDHSSQIDVLTSLFIPPLESEASFEGFQEIVARLRAPDGCPWDRQQTHQSLRPHFLEEAYEALQAIDEENLDGLKEELGDMLLQIVMQAQIATENGDFNMGEVIAGIRQKLIRRHPHVFADSDVKDVDQVLHNWEALKAGERGAKTSEGGTLAGVPDVLPALLQAWELQSRAARVGFDWPEVEGVIDKVVEELDEFRRAASEQQRQAELGDFLFALVNYARWIKIEPEAALREASARFRRRFGYIEQAAAQSGRALTDLSLEEMEAYWQLAKIHESGADRLAG